MDFASIVIYVIMGVSFVFSVLVLTGIIRTRGDGLSIVLEYLKEENANLKKSVLELKVVVEHQSEEIEKLKEQGATQRMQMVLMETSHNDLPYPAWMFNSLGNLVSANRAFEDTFLVPTNKAITDVMGFFPGDIMDEAAAKEYMKNHRWVLSQKRPWEGALTVNLNGKPEALNILLYPAFSGKQIIGVSGLLIPARRIENY